MEILYQTIGIIAMVSTIASWQGKNVKQILLFQGIGNILWTIHFLLLGSYAGAAMNGLSLIRCLGYYLIPNKKGKNIFTVLISLSFIGLAIITIIYFGEKWFIAVLLAIATITANIFYTIGNEKWCRLVQLSLVTPSWLFNNIWYMSIGGIICELCTIVSVIVSLIRFRKKNPQNKEEIK
ncbi:MAG: YgjV family protein [Bacilli bacterium]|nr:YgjV family protein [Bacilli bacterium]